MAVSDVTGGGGPIQNFDQPVIEGKVQVQATVSDTIESTKKTGGLSKLQTILDNVKVGQPTILAAQNAIEKLKGVVQQLGILASGGSGGTFSSSLSWLSSPMTQLAMNITLLVENMKESRKAELMATLTGIFMQWDSAKAAAAMKLNAAEAQAQMEMVKGFTGAMEAGAGAASAGASFGAASKLGKGTSFSKAWIEGGAGTATGQAVSGTSKAVEGFNNSQGIIAQKEAETQADMSETEKQIYNQVTQSASKSFDELEDMLKKALDALTNIWSTNARAQNTLTQNKQG